MACLDLKQNVDVVVRAKQIPVAAQLSQGRSHHHALQCTGCILVKVEFLLDMPCQRKCFHWSFMSHFPKYSISVHCLIPSFWKDPMVLPTVTS